MLLLPQLQPPPLEKSWLRPCLDLLIMFFNIRDKGIYNSFEVVPLFKRFTCKHKAETFAS